MTQLWGASSPYRGWGPTGLLQRGQSASHAGRLCCVKHSASPACSKCSINQGGLQRQRDRAGRPRGCLSHFTAHPPRQGAPQPSGTPPGGHQRRPWPGLACLGAQPLVYGLEKALIPGPSRHQSRARPGLLTAGFQPCHPSASLIIKWPHRAEGLSCPLPRRAICAYGSHSPESRILSPRSYSSTIPRATCAR